MNFQDIELERCYRSNTPFPPEEFYRTVFPVAKGFRRAAGYFTSTVFNLFNEEIIKFAKNGGKIELICSPFLTEEDTWNENINSLIVLCHIDYKMMNFFCLENQANIMIQ